MDDQNTLEKKNLQPITGKQYIKVDLNTTSLNDLFRLTNIQTCLLDLQSKDKEKVKTALYTLSSMVNLAGRRDALYVLVGYYHLEIKSMDDIIHFFEQIEMTFSPDLTWIILNDIVKIKEISRRILFVRDLVKHVNMVFRESSVEKKKSIENLVKNAVWGDKLKKTFLDELFYKRQRIRDGLF